MSGGLTDGAGLVEDVLQLLLRCLIGDVTHEDRPQGLVHDHVVWVVHGDRQNRLCKIDAI